MDWNVIVDFVLQQGIWCALFVWLFFTTKKESRTRETDLESIIKDQSETLQEITRTLEKMDTRIEKIEEKLEEKI